MPASSVGSEKPHGANEEEGGKPVSMPIVGIVGLGYVGLPLACAFGGNFRTVGFDIQKARVSEIREGFDRNGELSVEDIIGAPMLDVSDDPSVLNDANFIIVTVPTPVDKARRPDLGPLIEASRIVGRHLKPSNGRGHTIVVYESTVYPGVTEEICIPVLEQYSGLKSGLDFKVGYSPERVNPGDPDHSLDKVIKIVAGQDDETTKAMACVYGKIAKAGIHITPNIRTAEAAKVIENIQRDVNIALMNELAILFHMLDLDTRSVLEAAGTKWNFLPFEPGLVAGHCIPVDPYYLTHKAQEIGYHPEVILSGRRINDSMSTYIAREAVKMLVKAGKVVRSASVLVLGVAVKQDVRDPRNQRVAEMVREIEDHGAIVSVYDPLVDSANIKSMGFREIPDPFQSKGSFDAVILAVPHKVFRESPVSAYVDLFRSKEGPNPLLDIKGVLPAAASAPGIDYWVL